MERTKTAGVVAARELILRCLQGLPNGATRQQLIEMLRVHGSPASAGTFKRALRSLQDERDVLLIENTVDGKKRWSLANPGASLPLEDPSASDVACATMALALLSSVAADEVVEPVRNLCEQMDALHRQKRTEEVSRARPGAIVATMSSTTPLTSTMMQEFVAACSGGDVFRIRYYLPWQEHPPRESTYVVEPWQVRFHDGSLYLRAYSQSRESPRTFLGPQILSVEAIAGQTRRAQRPHRDRIWGDDLGVGVDQDRPDEAVLRFTGGYSRWVSLQVWHHAQLDSVDEAGVLTRRVRYSSCREFARRLLSAGDSLLSVEPEELRVEMARHIRTQFERLDRPKR